MSERPGLIVERVGHRFPRIAALRQVDLTVEPGEVHCLLGPSGSGKSTLLRLVAGLETLQQGRIAIDGTTVAAPGVHHRPEKRSVGLVFQDYALFPHLDVEQNVAFGMSDDPADRPAAVARLLNRVGMSGFERAMPHTLSGGQQQRVALARAMARKPRVMLLDEPFSGLDARLRDEVRGITLGLLRDGDVATLMVTHDPHEALLAAERISVVREGRIVQTGVAEQVYREPADRETAEMFGPVNRIGERFVRPENIRLFAEPEPGATEATVRARVTTGATVRILLALADGTSLEACDLSGSRWQVGQKVFVLRPDA